ncbi:hypothetical protein KPH14_007546 [Odynerus spinipes]|uniref:Uncharacterized protein n=1 Tax=Odynerus spinipes TaxID=1348599 RepID=A0AAD9RIG4_9HYME|nr:hypothetical protein KPH14_007546 [Odynerus spinipes]
MGDGGGSGGGGGDKKIGNVAARTPYEKVVTGELGDYSGADVISAWACAFSRGGNAKSGDDERGMVPGLCRVLFSPPPSHSFSPFFPFPTSLDSPSIGELDSWDGFLEFQVVPISYGLPLKFPSTHGAWLTGCCLSTFVPSKSSRR